MTDLIADSLATLNTVIDLAVLYIAAAATLAALTATAVIGAGYWTAELATWASRTLTHQHRKDNPQ